MTSRELVLSTLEFRNTTRTVPRDLWTLPWAEMNDAKQVARIKADFPNDFIGAPGFLRTQPVTKGDAYALGEYTDPWGCVFTNYQAGVIGEVKKPIIAEEDEDWEDLSRVHFPEEWLSIDVDQINAFCASTDKFVSPDACPRPFEQLQFLRGTEQLYMDLLTEPAGMLAFMERMHDLYKRIVTAWAKTDVDSINFMDDWGSQRSLLINPTLWDKYFRPMYQDYIDIGHAHGKKVFMHSDGYILDILPRLIDMGLDAINSQIFCMGMDKLEQFAGKITFWGEIDRQYLLANGTIAEVDAGVKAVRNTLWRNGGCIAQCEYGAGAKGENVYQVFKSWQE